MIPRVYIETTVVSYLTARPSWDVVIAGHQQVTHEWWDTRRSSYDLCISQLVLDEAGVGDPQAAQKRLSALQHALFLDTPKVATADPIVYGAQCATARPVPRHDARGRGLGDGTTPGRGVAAKAADDALHVAVAATQAVPFLLTWNCRHLANAVMRPVIEAVCRDKEFNAPIICTPEELLGAKP